MLYTAADFPEIDLLVISHDHWDHLDYSAVTGLLPKVKQVVCPLGVDGHLVGWGFPDEIVHELDWFEEYRLDERLTVCLTPSRHFSGRLFKGNQIPVGRLCLYVQKRTKDFLQRGRWLRMISKDPVPQSTSSIFSFSLLPRKYGCKSNAKSNAKNCV